MGARQDMTAEDVRAANVDLSALKQRLEAEAREWNEAADRNANSDDYHEMAGRFEAAAQKVGAAGLDLVWIEMELGKTVGGVIPALR